MTSDADAARHTDGVRRYYDGNTARFERLGQGGAAIRRAVWGPGIADRTAAFHYVDDLILDRLPTTTTRPLVVDLGCGVGASLIYLAGRVDLVGEGLTISSAQADRAARLVAAAGAADRVRCREGDYLRPPFDLAEADLAFSVEAFVHGPDPGRYFEAAARVLRPGGALVICDDFLGGHAERPPPAAARWIREFRVGWRIGSLVTAARACDLAIAAGFAPVADIDLTPYLEVRRPRDRWVELLATLARPLRLKGDYWRSLTGGSALQRALRTGWVDYRFLVFERSRPSPRAG
jgi:SAM-dependent methyltransferase